MTRVYGLLFLLAAGTSGAEIVGKWDGFLRPAAGNPVAVSLILQEKDGAVSGLAVLGADERQAPIEKGELRGDRLTFQAPDRANHLVAFDLTVTVRSMTGEAKADGQTLQVSLFPSVKTGPYRVGGGVSAPMLVSKTEPEYTEAAKEARYQGTVLLYVEISPEGKAINIRVLRSLGLGLDEKAMEAVKQWQFKPGMKDGSPVTVQAQIEVNFRLPG